MRIIRLHLTAPLGLCSYSGRGELPVIEYTRGGQQLGSLRQVRSSGRVAQHHVWAQFATARADARRRR